MVVSVPTQADFVEREIFRLVRVELQSPEDVAARLQLPVAEVRQIVARVTDGLIAAAPVESKEERQQRIQLSERVAAAQLTGLLREALRAFGRSQGEQTIVRQAGNGEPITLRRVSQGDIRYLNTAARIAAMAAKLPIGNFWEAPAKVDKPSANEPATNNHLVEDCSAATAEQRVTTSGFPITGDAKSTEELISDILSRGSTQPNMVNSRPVQQPSLVGGNPAAAKPKPR